jgi:hypothetical protein
VGFASIYLATSPLTEQAQAGRIEVGNLAGETVEQPTRRGPTGAPSATSASRWFSEDDAASYGVVDEITRRALLSGSRALAVRGDDVPGGGPVAAILRYAT